MKHLPHLYLITPEPAHDESTDLFLESISMALWQGIRLIQLRSRLLGRDAFHLLAIRVRELCDAAGATLLLNGPIDMEDHFGPWGIHLTSERLMQLDRRPVAAGTPLSASCHNLAELRHAARIGVDFATLSPVLPTPEQPQGLAMGWRRFSAIREGVALPVFALGGLTPEDLSQARLSGAHGIAAVEGLWPAALD